MSYNNQYQSNPYQQAPAAEQGGYDYNNQGANYNQGAYNNYDQVSTSSLFPDRCAMPIALLAAEAQD